MASLRDRGKRELIEAIVFSADFLTCNNNDTTTTTTTSDFNLGFSSCRERIVSFDSPKELTSKMDVLFHRKRSPFSSNAEREIREEEEEEDDLFREIVMIDSTDSISTCPSTTPSDIFNVFNYSNNSGTTKKRTNSNKRKELEVIPDVPFLLLPTDIEETTHHYDCNNNSYIALTTPKLKTDNAINQNKKERKNTSKRRVRLLFCWKRDNKRKVIDKRNKHEHKHPAKATINNNHTLLDTIVSKIIRKSKTSNSVLQSIEKQQQLHKKQPISRQEDHQQQDEGQGQEQHPKKRKQHYRRSSNTSTSTTTSCTNTTRTTLLFHENDNNNDGTADITAVFS